MPRAPQQCMNHKIHGENIRLKNHRNCIYKNKQHYAICKPCKRNSKKTENVAMSRLRKKTKNSGFIIIESVEEVNDETGREDNENSLVGDDVIVMIDTTTSNDMEIITTEDNNAQKIEDKLVPTENGFPLLIIPPAYPYNIINPETQIQIKELHGQALVGPNPPSILYDNFEDGRWKVVCRDEKSCRLFIDEVSSWSIAFDNSATKFSFKVLQKHQVPEKIDMSCIVTQPIDGDKFLCAVNHINSSKWDVIKFESINEGTKVHFTVDPLSFHLMCSYGFDIKVKNEIVAVAIEKNPFATEFDEHFMKLAEIKTFNELQSHGAMDTKVLCDPNAIDQALTKMEITLEDLNEILQNQHALDDDFQSDKFSDISDTSSCPDIDDINPSIEYNEDEVHKIAEELRISAEKFEHQQLMLSKPISKRAANHQEVKSEAESNSVGLPYAITPLRYPQHCLSEDDYAACSQQINSEIEKIPASERVPRFRKSCYEDGMWKVNCADEYSRDWLQNQVSEIGFLVDGVEETFKMIPLEEIPIYKLTAKVASPVMTDAMILPMLKKQNRDIKLETSSWKNVNISKLNNKEFMLDVEVDPLSYEKIRNNDFKLYLGMNEVVFCSN